MYNLKNVDLKEAAKCVMCADAPCSKGCLNCMNPAESIRSVLLDNEIGAAHRMNDVNLCEKCDAPCEKECLLQGKREYISIKKIMGQLYKDRESMEILSNHSIDLSVELCGVKLENPFLLSSSVVASSYDMCARAFERGWAGAAFKTICLMEQHEASPRFSALKRNDGSFYGFKNIEQLSDHSVQENMEIFRRLKKEYPTKVLIASIMGRNEGEWTYLAREAEKAGANIIECNFSCPNMEQEDLGVAIGQVPELIEKFTRAAQKEVSIPVLAKLTPNVADMVPMAIAAKRGGACGIAAINTINSITDVNLDSLAPSASVRGKCSVGGYSGAAVKPIALRFISDLALCKELSGMHISGMGGINTWKDAMEFLLLGAGSLQITTAVMEYGYRIIDDLLDGMRVYLQERNIDNIRELIGTSVESIVNRSDLERDTILLPQFLPDKCIGCGRCYISCMDGGHQAIVFDEVTRKPKLIGNKCVGCHLCRLVCPGGAIGVAKKRIRKRVNNPA